jgi:hypothetical protein
MDTRRTAGIIRLGLLVGLLAAGAAGAGAAFAADAEASPGTWQKHQYSFVAMSFTSTYSCEGLADKLKILLLAAGARPDVKAQGSACASGFGQVDKLARAELTFYTLVPDAIANADAKAGAGGRADGRWRPVTLTARSPRELGMGDCELVDQFRAQVLPMFATRDVSNHTTCVPHQDSGSLINLKFEAFAAVPAKPQAARAAN